MGIIEDGLMAGEPRLDGHRVTVLQVVDAVEDFGGVDEATQQLRISANEVEEAKEYARSHPEKMADIRDEWHNVNI